MSSRRGSSLVLLLLLFSSPASARQPAPAASRFRGLHHLPRQLEPGSCAPGERCTTSVYLVGELLDPITNGKRYVAHDVAGAWTVRTFTAPSPGVELSGPGAREPLGLALLAPTDAEALEPGRYHLAYSKPGDDHAGIQLKIGDRIPEGLVGSFEVLEFETRPGPGGQPEVSRFAAHFRVRRGQAAGHVSGFVSFQREADPGR